jgi:hypothetical protein
LPHAIPPLRLRLLGPLPVVTCAFGASFSDQVPRRAHFGAGFAVDGNVPTKLLVRAAGPTLADPVLEIRPLGSGTVVARNDNRTGTAVLKTAFASAGAFAFATDDARDAAPALGLPPGASTVSGKYIQPASS